MSNSLAKAVKRAKHIYLCGNGGSAANASHIANDWIACGVKAHALTDVATITAIANDFGYEHIFSRQLLALATKKDLLVVLSGSGRSVNILRALDAGDSIGMEAWAIFGGYGNPYATRNMILAGENMQDAEEQQLVIGHEVMKCLKHE